MINHSIAIVVLGVLGLIELTVRILLVITLTFTFFIIIAVVDDTEDLENLITPFCWHMLADYIIGVTE